MDTNKLIEKLIEFESTESNYVQCVKCLEFIKDYARKSNRHIFSYDFENNKKRSILLSTKNNFDFNLLMIGHIDVVPAPSAMFQPRIINGKIHGRGSSDMKGVVAAMINTIINIKSDKNIGLYISSDEEQGGFDCSGKFSKTNGLKYRIIFNPDSLPNNTLTIGQKGFTIIKLIAKGRTAHGSEPWLGDNAIEKLVQVISEIKHKQNITIIQSNAQSAGIIDRPTLNVSNLIGGSAINQVPDHAECIIDIRYYYDAEKYEILNKIYHICKNHKIILTTIIEGNPTNVNKDTKEIKKFLKILSKNKVTYRIARETGSSDARFFPNADSYILFSPLCSEAHQSDEWVDIKSLAIYEKCLQEYIYSLE